MGKDVFGNFLALVAFFSLLIGVAPQRSEGAKAKPANLNAQTAQALVEALHGERQNLAFYKAAVKTSGEIRPFPMLARAAGRHVEHTLVLFRNYGLPIPADPFEDAPPEAPSNPQAACAKAAELERTLEVLYSRLLNFIEEEDIRKVFLRHKNSAGKRHVAALERCGGFAGGD